MVKLDIGATNTLRLVRDSIIHRIYEFLFAFFVFLSPAFAGYVFAGHFGQRTFANKLPVLLVLTGGALDFHAMVGAPVGTRTSEASSDEKTATSPIMDAINQNAGQSDGYPVGVPRHFAWYRGSHKPPVPALRLPDFTAVTGWGEYPKVAAPKYTDPEGSIIIANAKTYVHLSVTLANRFQCKTSRHTGSLVPALCRTSSRGPLLR